MEVPAPNTNANPRTEAIHEIIQASAPHHIVSLAGQVYDLREKNRDFLEVVKQLTTRCEQLEELVQELVADIMQEFKRQDAKTAENEGVES